MSAAPVMPPLAEDKSVVAVGLEAFGKTQYVCSFHFMPITVERDYRTRVQGGYSTKYVVQGITDAKQHPSVLPVLDAFQRVYQGADRVPRWQPTPELSINIAKDIVHAATGSDDSNPSLLAPAVWISAAARVPRTEAEWSTWGTPQFTQSFSEFAIECQQYFKRQWRFSEEKVKEGDGFNTQKLPLNINSIHRLAAKFVGANRVQHEWIDQTVLGTEMQCPYCGVKASSEHPLCGNCQKVLNPKLMKKIEEELAKA